MNRLRRLTLSLALAITLAPFISAGAGRPLGSGAPTQVQAQVSPGGRKRPEARQIRTTILFFNDLHGHLMPFRIQKGDGTQVEVGGVAGIATLVKEIRAENARKGIRTVLLMAGDVLQGTPMSTVFQGRPDIEVFNALGVDAMTVGNHEFDFGLDNFLRLKKMARFPIISSNVVWKRGRSLMNRPSATFPLGQGINLTVIGATTQELLVTTAPGNVEKVDVLDSVQTVSKGYRKARRHGPVLLLSHSKFQTDSEIAKANPGLTAIIGGHDQILFDPAKYAAGVPVFQAFEKGRFLGRLDIVVNPRTGRAAIEKWAYIPITAEIRQDPEIARLLEAYNAQLSATFKEVVGESLVFLDGERGRIRYEETNLGNFVSDIMRQHTGSDLALLNAGSLRASLDKGPVTIEDIFKVMPYPNEILVARLTGAELLEALVRSVRGSREDEDGGFLHVSGITMRIRGHSVTEVKVGGNPIDPARTYTVTLTDFMHAGGDGYKVFTGKPATNTRLPLRELLVDTIRKQGRVTAKVDGRMFREQQP
ncbi:bifunctional metallophosphatase/5'-nucleotidase [Holophaga foetida]|uniref:bifunctional metallophosphatase/5'-nucleotidase n=1 Tax=Holophaga foetida TaxID=35839 RepID=UPI0002471CF6|nr:5'-nucleotidase C-terminal domain-containing protein [Holophaga foetida]